MRFLLLLCLSCSGTDSEKHGLGLSCASNVDCVTSLVCVSDDPGGQCTRFCTDDSQCGSGALCDPEGKCYQACKADDDCPRHALDSAYGCAGSGTRRFCDAFEQSDGGSSD